MIKFLLKGLIRDKTRSLFPFLTVTLGVMLTVFLYSYTQGALTQMVDYSAKFATGHVKITTRGYAAEESQKPLDLALVGVSSLIEKLNREYPNMIWCPRIVFGGLLDVPDEKGETRIQSPVAGTAVDLLSKPVEIEILNIKKGLVRGKLPTSSDEILISEQFARRLKVNPGDKVTLITNDAWGGLAIKNFRIAGTLNFGVDALDRQTIFADLKGVQNALALDDAAGEILGFFKDFVYRDIEAKMIAEEFNKKYGKPGDELSPFMRALSQQPGMEEYISYIKDWVGIFIAIFIFAMSIVLWNSGLLGGLRRYSEIGVRLALGEDKGHIYRTLLGESLIIGIFGTVAGTLLGLGVSYYVQVHGINMSQLFKNATIMLPNVIRARITPGSFYVGFIPGLIAPLIGTALSGIGVYKRETSSLIREFAE
ncbi:MAG: ABC transporter permease [Candidatus Aminicenantes bacterium]|nr:ABC transporter permease [Candidatus Aminicenantes bacterium]